MGRQIFTGETYHVFNKSIAGFRILDYLPDSQRMLDLISYYRKGKRAISFYRYLSFMQGETAYFKSKVDPLSPRPITVIAYCLMPTHIHLILRQEKDHGVSEFMSLIGNGYTKYFNLKYKRKGPLWESRFKNVRVRTDEQLLHLTRYIHLNPVTAGIIDRPEQWQYSSYKEYLGLQDNNLCDFQDLFDFTPASYREFVLDHIGYQRDLALIKHLLCEEESLQ